MNADDVGTGLWVLVYHLFRRHSIPQDAYRELTLRTGMPYVAGDAELAVSVNGLMETKWYHEMCNRYRHLRQEIRTSHANDINETHDLVSSLYPAGSSLSELMDAVQTCAAMLTYSIPEELVFRFTTRQGALMENEGRHQLSAEELAGAIIEGPLIDSFVPPRWWRPSMVAGKGPSSVGECKPLRVGLRCHPLEMVIEYERPTGQPRQRRIRLGTALQAVGPTAYLGKRLAATHDAILSEEVLQGLLIKLQRLMKQAEGQKEGDKDPRASVAASPPSKEAAAPRGTAEPISGAAPPTDTPHDERGRQQPQKADLGLLYRDPEKALANVDLNDADDVTLKEFKEVMNEKFEMNVIKPGDPGYVYDKRVVVEKPTQRSEWDDSD